jgi:hypothetical protein
MILQPVWVVGLFYRLSCVKQVIPIPMRDAGILLPTTAVVLLLGPENWEGHEDVFSNLVESRLGQENDWKAATIRMNRRAGDTIEIKRCLMITNTVTFILGMRTAVGDILPVFGDTFFLTDPDESAVRLNVIHNFQITFTATGGQKPLESAVGSMVVVCKGKKFLELQEAGTSNPVGTGGAELPTEIYGLCLVTDPTHNSTAGPAASYLNY